MTAIFFVFSVLRLQLSAFSNNAINICNFSAFLLLVSSLSVQTVLQFWIITNLYQYSFNLWKFQSKIPFQSPSLRYQTSIYSLTYLFRCHAFYETWRRRHPRPADLWNGYFSPRRFVARCPLVRFSKPCNSVILRWK